MRWEAYTKGSATHDKAKTIEGYIEHKCRESHFRTEMSKLVYDYIDYGNAFSTADYESTYVIGTDGARIQTFVGPRAYRISPLDIVFDPLAASFEKSFKIVRSLKGLGEIQIGRASCRERVCKYV